MGQHGPTWGQLGGQLGANLGPAWPNMGQHGANLGPTWANLGQLGPTWGSLRPARANMSQRGPTWGQLEANMDLEIIEKPLFFLGFFNISRKSLEVIGNALGQPLGTPWGALGDALGTPWEVLGDALEDLLGRPWKRPPLGRPNKEIRSGTYEAS